MFSVVIPTLQKSELLYPLVHMYCEHPLVGEVIIVNNAPEPLPFDHPKVRILQQTENIYVNPAWNLGVSEAREEFLIISSDDISLDPRTIDFVARKLLRPVGIIGMGRRVYTRRRSTAPRLFPSYVENVGFGALMFLPKDNYVPIPDDLLIWGGDNWLYHNQRHRNFSVAGIKLGTKSATTAGLAEFKELLLPNQVAYLERYRVNSYRSRYPLGVVVHSIWGKSLWWWGRLRRAPSWALKRVRLAAAELQREDSVRG